MIMDFTRSPFESVFNFFGGLSEGHEKALKHALYNSLALVILLISCAAVWALYIILGPFISPLLWALMCGSVLHPFQYSLATKFHQWISDFERQHSPVLLCFIMLPFNCMNNVTEIIGSHIFNYIKPILAVILGGFCLHVIYSYTPTLCLCIVWKMGSIIGPVMFWFINKCTTSMVATVMIGYLVLLTLFWQPAQAHVFKFAAWPVWILLSGYLANMVGTCQVPIFLIIQFLLVSGFLLDAHQIFNQQKTNGNPITFRDALNKSFSNTIEVDVKKMEPSEVEDKVSNKSSEDEEEITDGLTKTDYQDLGALATSPSQTSRSRPQHISFKKTRSLSSVQFQSPQTTLEGQIMNILRDRSRSIFSQNEATETTNQTLLNPQSSDKFIYGIMWACLAMLIFNHLWTLYFVPIPIFIYLVKHTGNYFGLWQIASIQLENLKTYLVEWWRPRQLAFCPVPIKGLTAVAIEIHKKAMEILKNSVDSVACIVVIFAVIIFAISTTIFIAVQVYAEGMHMIQVGANVVNSTLLSNSELLNQVLPADWSTKVDSVVDNAYLQGRSGISNMVRSWLVDVDRTKVEHLEKQVLDLWDRIYQSWMMSGSEENFIGPIVSPIAVWENFVSGIHMPPEEIFDTSAILSFAKINMDSLLSVMETIWTISKGNISFALRFLTTIMSVLFGGGTAILNLLINTVVFFTALFYLLSSSGVLYKPVELITNFSPTYGNRFAVALETALTGVFKASLKMAVFYGLWTWFIHNMFRMKIVYLPSVLAALLAAVPFLGTYWACIPAVIDLWLVQNKGMEALLLFTFQFLPTQVVDTAIYKEIDGGGHPYLTGLSIAGGIFWLGAEGAIIGPVVLCGLFVIINLSSALMMDTPTEGKMAQRLNELNELAKFRGRTHSYTKMGKL